MADEKKTVEEVETDTEETESKGQVEQTFTQDQVNKLVGEARKKERSKYADYKELKEVAANAQDLQNKYDEASDKLAKLEHEKQVATWKTEAAKEYGVDTSILRGDNEEEIMAHAKQIKEKYSYPKVDLSGVPKDAHIRARSDEEKTADSLGQLIYVD